MTIKYNHRPETKDELKELVAEYFEKGKTNLNDIDTSLITDMSCLFRDVKCNFDVSEWNVENVENMREMFLGCTKFNCDLSKWNVGKVVEMTWMFDGCLKFNSDIGKWNTRNVKQAWGMFYKCFSFNQDLSKWSMRNNINYNQLFYLCPVSVRDEQKPKYIDLYGNE